ncbi:hypothetical protein PV326_002084, partial [Microctonus aethiopoides]
TEEIYNRASIDMVFATKLLMRRINEGITEFNDSVDSFDCVDDKTGPQMYPGAGTSTATTSSTTSSGKSCRKRSVLDVSDAKSAVILL